MYMDIDYKPLQLLKLRFSSDQLINIRIVANDQIKVIQCRTNMTFVTPIDLTSKNVITVENLTKNCACNIAEVDLNFLNITPIAYMFTETFVKDGMSKIGDFVSDLYSPDICKITIQEDHLIYKKILPYFKNGTVKYAS